MKRWLGLWLGLLVCGCAWSTPNAPGERHFRVGPFFEWGERDGEMARFALRPFYAWEREPVDRYTKDMDVLWPLSHFGWRGEAFHWRVLMAFWRERDVTNVESRDYSFSLPPIWMNGRYGEENYWGLFPIYGHLPKLALLEDVRWAGFPLYLSYRTGGSRAVKRQYFVWPFLSAKHDPDKTRWSLWPLYGVQHEPDYDAWYALWPLWRYRAFHSERPQHNGYAWMLWPLYEQTSADTESGWGVLPPFFRSTRTTDGAHLLRAPWPLFERYTDKKESTWKVWRFWGMTHRGSRSGWWFCYPVVASQKQETKHIYKESFRFWPFYANEVSYGIDAHGKAELESSYFRIWPFYSSTYNEQEGLTRKSVKLLPLRDVPPIERNWAPFWTFYRATQKPGSDEVLHELFWGLIWWRTHPGPYPEQYPLETDADNKKEEACS